LCKPSGDAVSLPYYKRFPRDFLDGTIGLCLETKGAYAIVLDLIYMRDGRLADDARYIAGQLGCSVRKWTSIRKELLAAGKIQCANGIISNFRADYLTEESRKYQDNQREIAGLPRKNNTLRQPKPSQSESEPDSKRVTNVTLVRPPDLFAEFWSRWPVKKSRKAAHAAYLKALKETDHGTLVAAVDAQRRWPEWAVARYIPHAATWLNRGGWADEPRGSEGEGVAGNTKASGNRSGDTSFADIAARRKREREAGMEIPGRQAAVSGDDFGWGIGAIDGQCAAGDWQG
jgi:uncharacterized protein YdaU (DUF1376 family)